MTKVKKKNYKHTGDKPYQCHICDIHPIKENPQGEQTYQCHHCDKSLQKVYKSLQTHWR